ncbi:hypothetical protein [Natrarchaeobaculum sulfurireducens]|uniref:Uncharacterized protein n=1 Tax=Natrarchaeobaculum sulfurireducens TaxID=2044521 RepID=A0A346PLL1_9EURY|nr:hypothetical protein [Natrarchaeobaculum sulfurireducens]AXR76735.1 hypothetical protein AArc1_0391 [Natrarchaeobaculum sulfurireducens]AXR80406.1 hypothetical protein AArcMg_0383 [Natrarchaeobaculum sulfurireducens]
MTWDDPRDTPETLREEAAEYDEIVAALEDLIAEVRDEPVKGSRLEGLYDEVTTSDPGIWNTATAFIDVEDGEAVVTEESKLAQGKWAPEIVEGCDAMVTLEIQTGLMPDDFKYLVSKEADDRIDEFREAAAKARQRAAELEAGDDED